MPTIVIKKKDLETLLAQAVDLDKLPAQLSLVKGEVKGYDEAAGEIKVELNDTNRPDLWSVEGLARQIRTHRRKKPEAYPFYSSKKKAAGVVKVAEGVREVRPYLGACIAKGLNIDEETLVQLIQVQEKLSDSFGRKRRLVSIGLYRLDPIQFPVHYKTARPGSTRFVPLGFEEPMTLKAILEKHPKGIAYRETLGKAPEYPLLVDSGDTILSFPPIINSRAIGEVRVGDRDLFVEVTGTDLRMVALTVNILAANLADRGAEIAPVEIRYPFSTVFGRKMTMPMPIAGSLAVRPEDFSEALGEAVSIKDAVSTLVRYGYTARPKGKKIEVSVPPFRDDLLHPIDVVEDYAISRGYDSFEPRMPSEFSVGGLTAIERFSDRVRDSMVGMGFQEILSNILTDRSDFRDKMGLRDDEKGGVVVSVANVMS
ncbi:MAG TPA: phenylalanine--tRNA ligase subunit beta, partial [Nitrospiria bacterium]|nr:phenylalanine--tRNA ligase subunit beta [Nitrospiria bacterium]